MSVPPCGTAEVGALVTTVPVASDSAVFAVAVVAVVAAVARAVALLTAVDGSVVAVVVSDAAVASDIVVASDTGAVAAGVVVAVDVVAPRSQAARSTSVKPVMTILSTNERRFEIIYYPQYL